MLGSAFGAALAGCHATPQKPSDPSPESSAHPAVQASASTAAAGGRPPSADRDGDGVPDELDVCPAAPGPRTTERGKPGCPLRPIADIPLPVLEVHAIQFAPGSAKLAARKGASEPYPRLIEIVKELGRFEDHCVLIVGHADTQTDAPPRDALSRRRAEAVKRYLVEHSAPANRLGVLGHADVCATERTGDHEGNRRVTFAVSRCPLDPQNPQVDCGPGGWFLLQPFPEPEKQDR
jgi:outer membrane protein OmpA-like peptidoglycan-associated protein